MPNLKPEIQGMNFVIVGDFNPKIFHPAWFSKHGLIGDHESEEANVQVVHSDIAVFSFEWMKLQVTRDRFDLSTTQEPFFEVIRDLAISTFQILEHTPANMLGINHQMHYKMSSEEEWHNFGHRLAPKDCWNKVLKNPGMQKTSIKAERPDDYKGNLLVSVEPSTKIKHGAYFTINDHFEVETPEGVSGMPQLVDIIKTTWGDCAERAKVIPRTILEG